jgi:hypothetical protein
MDEERRSKRSRFDETEPRERPRNSRFDRRSRSPREVIRRRSRSRSPQPTGTKEGNDAAAAAGIYIPFKKTHTFRLADLLQLQRPLALMRKSKLGREVRQATWLQDDQ